MSFQWRRFQFFDKDSFADEDSRLALGVLQDFPAPITASTSGPRYLVFANKAGQVRLVNRDYETTTFTAHEGGGGGVSHVHLLSRHAVLVTLGDDEQQPTLRFFLLDRVDASGHPVCAKRLPVFSRAFPPSPITCLAVMEDLSQCAIGCVNGTVLLLGDGGSLLKEKTAKAAYLIKDIGSSVTALMYREEEPAPPSPSNPFPLPSSPPSLFVCTTDSISSFYTKQAKASPPPRIDLDASHGVEVGLAHLADDEVGRKLIVGRKEAVYSFDSEEQSEVFAFEGAKKLLGWHHHCLVVVSEGVKEVGAAVKDQLTLYDLKNKFIAFQVKSDPIINLLPAFASLYTLTQPQPAASASSSSSSSSPPAYALQHYVEKDLSSKMDVLFKKNLYPIAISLALSSSSDASLIVDIYQQYGDHAYAKCDYDQAITQYCETIGYTEPSYVIRKFLDAQRIHNLTKYLQTLHEKGRANSDHTTLLLNCYTKLKEVDKLNEFVRSDVGWVFDVVTAITVCRQAGYFDHALFLAQKHGQHDLYIKVQLEDVIDSTQALHYIRSLAWADADRFITKYGKRFVTDLPADTTAALMQLSTHWVPTPLPSSPLPPNPPAGPAEKSHPEHFVSFFVDHPAELQSFLESVQHEPHCSSTVYNTLLELYLRRGEEEEGKKAADAGSGGGGAGASAAHASHDGGGSHPYTTQIMNLLKSFHGKYDMDHALVLCKLYHFEKGILYLYAKLSYFSEILQHHIEHRQHSRIIPVCIKYGSTLPNLWVQALTYFAHQHDANYEDEITQVLEHVERMNLLAPLMVINILSGGGGSSGGEGGGKAAGGAGGAGGKPISVLQDYIVKLLKDEQSVIVSDTAEIVRYQHDTAAMKEEMQRLRTQPVTFQVGKCSGCGQSLSLPAVHFLCMHSYHLRCCDGGRGGADVVSGDGSGVWYECSRCSAEYRKVREIKESMKSSATAHDRFFKQLEDSPDGFATVAEYFGRGIFEQ